MTITKLVYRPGLGYAGAGALPTFDPADHDAGPNCWTITFRKVPKSHLHRSLRKVSAITRLHVPDGTSEVRFVGVEEDSPLAPLLIWDVVHSAEVGTCFRFQDAMVGSRYLDRPYFTDGVTREEDGSATTFRKIRKLPAEGGDLGSWTFGIPTGPEDATLLNACVARILELEIPNKEILLCGRPAANFRYWDQVRIVGEDITAPPVQICRKKNRLVEEARHENICLVHDRVFLPRNFRKAMDRFGNTFPFTALQSLYFDDKWNLVYRRYSDFGLGLRLPQHLIQGLARDDRPAPDRYAPGIFSKIERTGFVHANAHRYNENNYPTGSLYIVKKRVWQQCPQDERLRWIEFEDIEQGERAAARGIPSRVNPYAFTQSMISRPILSWLGYSTCEKINGSERQFRSRYEAMSFLPRKPLLKKMQSDAVRDHDAFLTKWTIRPSSGMEPATAATTTTRRRLRWIIQAVAAVHLPIHRDTIQVFLKDFEKLVIGDQIPYEWHEKTAAEFAFGPELGMKRLMETCYEIFNQAAQRPKKRIFAIALADYFPKKSLMLLLGSMTVALLMMGNRHQFVFVGGWYTRLRAILGSTPYERYALGTKRSNG